MPRSQIGRSVWVAALFAAVFSIAIDARDSGVESGTQVEAREEAGVYHVSARFDISQPASVALRVLTDYENIPRFIPDVKSSIVRERSAERILVEQEAVARALLFSKRIHLCLDVRLSDGTVSFRDTSGRSFTRYAGAWHVREHTGKTTVLYELAAQPSFDVPAFLLTRLLKRDAAAMIERLQREMNARAKDLGSI